MHKLLRAPRGCPTYGKAAVEPPAHGGELERSGVWGRGRAAGRPAHFPPRSRTLSPFSP